MRQHFVFVHDVYFSLKDNSPPVGRLFFFRSPPLRARLQRG